MNILDDMNCTTLSFGLKLGGYDNVNLIMDFCYNGSIKKI